MQPQVDTVKIKVLLTKLRFILVTASGKSFSLKRVFNNTKMLHKPHTLLPTNWISGNSLTDMTAFLSLAIFIASLLTILNISIFATTVSRLRRHLDKPLLGPSIMMVGLYPIISVAALVTILVPYSWFICHTVMHVMFMVGGPVFRTLLFRYVGSEQNYVKETAGEAVQLNTPPCCCCCLCLPMVIPTKAKLCISRYMVCPRNRICKEILFYKRTHFRRYGKCPSGRAPLCWWWTSYTTGTFSSTGRSCSSSSPSSSAPLSWGKYLIRFYYYYKHTS